MFIHAFCAILTHSFTVSMNITSCVLLYDIFGFMIAYYTLSLLCLPYHIWSPILLSPINIGIFIFRCSYPFRIRDILYL